MTRSNRTLNRVVLVLVALLWLAVAAGIALVAWPEAGRPVGLELPRLEIPTTRPVLIGVVVGAAVLVILAIAWIATRGRGRTRDALREGSTTIEAGAVQDLVRARLDGDPDLLSVRVDAHRLRGGTILRIRAEVRRAADVARLRRTIDAALAELDETLGATPPMLIHLTDGIRSRLHADRTVS